MKTHFVGSLMVFLLISLFSCSSIKQANTGKKTLISVQMGTNIGGITENTDMSVVPGVKVPPEAGVDAFTGATNPGFNAGVQISHQLKRNRIETGLEYMYNFQKFNYIDVGNRFIGVRELHVSQLMVPLTYNFVVPAANLQVKVGVVGQLNYVSGQGFGILPEYTYNPFSAGPTLGIAFLPFHFAKGDKLGVYCDVYRGSQIYEDYYNKPEYEIPGSSFIKFGLKYQFH